LKKKQSGSFVDTVMLLWVGIFDVLTSGLLLKKIGKTIVRTLIGYFHKPLVQVYKMHVAHHVNLGRYKFVSRNVKPWYVFHDVKMEVTWMLK
jgi:hypothetical protein